MLGGICEGGGDEREPFGRLSQVHTGEHADELVTSVANDQVMRAQLFLEAAGDGEQQPVTGGVSERVVDDLQMVDVDEGKDERLA